MIAVRSQAFSLFVDRTTQQWVVRDPDGRFWIVPAGEEAWERRRPFDCTDDIDLEPIPGHYKYLFQLPF